MENFDLEKIKKYFPFSEKAVDAQGLLISIIIYLVIGAIGGILIGLVDFLWIIPKILGAVVELYVLLGIILSVLKFLEVQGGNNGGSDEQ